MLFFLRWLCAQLLPFYLWWCTGVGDWCQAGGSCWLCLQWHRPALDHKTQGDQTGGPSEPSELHVYWTIFPPTDSTHHWFCLCGFVTSPLEVPTNATAWSISLATATAVMWPFRVKEGLDVRANSALLASGEGRNSAPQLYMVAMFCWEKK